MRRHRTRDARRARRERTPRDRAAIHNNARETRATRDAPAARVTTVVVDDRRAMRVVFDARVNAARFAVDVVNIVVESRRSACAAMPRHRWRGRRESSSCFSG